MGPQVDFTSRFAMVLDFEPLVEVSLEGEGGNLYFGFAYFVVFGNIFVHNNDFQVITDVFNVERARLVPFRVLSFVLLDFRLPLLFTVP